MKKFIIQSIAILLVLFGTLAYSTGKLPGLSFTNGPKQTEIQVGDTKLKVELADTTEKRKKGLGGRDNLATDSGMLFIFPKADYYNFWMKGMKFPLDLIWIKDGNVVDITKNAPPPTTGQSDQSLPIYTPTQEADSVLEVNAGFSDSHNIKIGDNIKIEK